MALAAPPTRSAASPSGRRVPGATTEPPGLCVLLLPRPLEPFILRDQAEDLLRRRASWPSSPRGVPYGALRGCRRRSPTASRPTQARRLRAARRAARAVVIFHPLQYPLARALLAQHPDAELWYGRWDRYEEAYDAVGARCARGSGRCTALASRARRLTFVVSDELAELEREEGREAVLVPLAADPSRRPTRARRSSRSRSATSATGPTGRCCARWPSGCPSSCCCSSARGTTTSPAATPTSAWCRARAQPRLARAPHRRGGRAADPVRRRRHRPVRALGRSTTPRCPTGSSSTRASGAAR